MRPESCAAIAQYTDATALHIHLDFGKVRGKGIDEMRRTPSRGLGRRDIPWQAGHGSSQVEAPLWRLNAINWPASRTAKLAWVSRSAPPDDVWHPQRRV